ncbi:CDP-alcohol phosphatidyltransferase family protein [Methylocapsa acidiphila]|uniref:CDP-alcohol phosphatidyltransferase family protein n=1 Tax=Methylocapsa acidiphila TaxID=133552 RepID=UPI00047C6984|nr:CDP-alcohol phosphatidyltransferase family protein [Methylocapsa acidiphila]
MTISLYRSLPNFITVGRLALVPAIIAAISAERWRAACLLFVVAGLSDAADGWIAKSFDLRSELGAYLDPLADKALIVSIYVALAIVGAVPATISILVVARDVMIVGAFMVSWFLHKPMAVRPLLISKLNTLVQLGCAAMVLAVKAFDFPVGSWFEISLFAVAFLTIASMAAYFEQWMKHMSV